MSMKVIVLMYGEKAKKGWQPHTENRDKMATNSVLWCVSACILNVLEQYV